MYACVCVCVCLCVCVCVEENLGVSLIIGNFLRHIDVGWCEELFLTFSLHSFTYFAIFFKLISLIVKT